MSPYLNLKPRSEIDATRDRLADLERSMGREALVTRVTQRQLEDLERRAESGRSME